MKNIGALLDYSNEFYIDEKCLHNTTTIEPIRIEWNKSMNKYRVFHMMSTTDVNTHVSYILNSMKYILFLICYESIEIDLCMNLSFLKRPSSD